MTGVIVVTGFRDREHSLRERFVVKSNVGAVVLRACPAQVEEAMLSHCTNPGCSSPFRSLEDGRLFRVEKNSRNATRQGKKYEYFWLCSSCSTHVTLALNHDASVRVESLDHPVGYNSAKYGFVSLERKPDSVLSWLPRRNAMVH